ncbi:MAG: urease accessory protein UreD [Pseudomonadota bacterium]|nr:urease accessory protein UreD [Pseudomonadota bacterium]
MSAIPLNPGWDARLELGYQRRGERTVLVHRRHHGPLRVQKPLYPEGEGVCHTLVLHPPAGIVGGDRLALTVALESDAHALLTTPGAAKWYRSGGARAHQQVALRVAERGCVEWLPQEAIVYDGAQARQALKVELARDARFLGLDILCLGRRASGEHFAHGRFGISSSIDQLGVPLWREWGTLQGGAAMLAHPTGLRGAPVCATVLAAGIADTTTLVQALRAALPAGDWSATALPGVLVARWLGQAGEAARHWFAQLWQLLRPALCGRPAQLPRIWST